MKKFLIFMLVTLMICSLCACGNKEPEPSEGLIEVKPATHHVASYRVNEWRVEGTKDYYTILSTYSNDFYAEIEETDILYLKDGYQTFKEVFPNSEITIYNFNSSKSGVGAYIKIHTNQLIDLKKVYILTEGPETYIEGITTKEAFEAEEHENNNWVKFYTSIFSASVPFNDINSLNNSQSIAVITGANARAYCDATNYETTVNEDNEMVFKFKYDMFTAMDEEAIETMLLSNFRPAANRNGEIVEILLPEGLEIFADFDEEFFYVGIKSIENKPISEYDVEYILNIVSPNMKFALTTP